MKDDGGPAFPQQLPEWIINANNPLIPHDHPFFKMRTADDDRREVPKMGGGHTGYDGNDVTKFNSGMQMRHHGSQEHELRIGDDAGVRNRMGR
jgi:hypothetical protein